MTEESTPNASVDRSELEFLREVYDRVDATLDALGQPAMKGGCSRPLEVRLRELVAPNASPAYPEPQQVCTCCGVACGACYARQFEAANATPRLSIDVGACTSCGGRIGTTKGCTLCDRYCFGPTRDESTPENKAFWDGVRKSAEGVKGQPAWTGAGINLNPKNFETYAPESAPRPSEAERFRTALEKVNAIRNSIVGMQGFNFSEHAYPLVAALDEAGFKGLPYPEARANLGTLIERATKAEDELERLRATLSSGPATPAEDLRDADLDRLTARECFEYLSRGLEGGEAAILKAVAMTRAHERRKRRP